jgi:hypothetical protein
MLSSNTVPAFYYNNFAAAISSPFTSLNAYNAGVIDANGNILKPESSIDPFEYLVIKLKKIFAELPYGSTKAKLNQYASALQLFAEEASQFGLDKTSVNLMIEGFIAAESKGKLSYIELVEDMSSANLGGPASSPAANTGSVTGYDKPLGSLLTRKPASILGFEKQPCEMYDVCPQDFDELSNPNIKSWDEVPDSETKKFMQRSQRRNRGPAIIIRDIGTNRYHKLNLAPRNISKMYENVDLSIFKTVLSEEQAATIAYQDDPSQKETNVAVETNSQERRDVSNPHHVKKMAESHLLNIMGTIKSQSKNKALTGHAALHEIRTRMAMTLIGMHDSALDDKGSRQGIAQDYFEQISKPSYVSKSISTPGKDFIAYSRNARKNQEGKYEFVGGESKHRPSGRISIPTEPILSAYDTDIDREIAKTTFEHGHGSSSIRPTGKIKGLWDIVAQEPIKKLMGGLAVTEIGRGTIPHSLNVSGGFTPVLVHGRGVLDFANYLATHRSAKGNLGIRTIRPTGSPSRVQTEFGDVKIPDQMTHLLDSVRKQNQRQIIVDDKHIKHLRNRMLGDNPSEEHKSDVDAIIRDWTKEMALGGFYKPNREIALTGQQISEVL